jgi:hypothetical protein
MREKILKILRCRRHLIQQGKSYKNTMLCHKYMRQLDAWLQAFPHATDAQVQNWARSNADEIGYLIPSSKHPAHIAQMQTFKSIIS